jgi:hypothetical protein
MEISDWSLVISFLVRKSESPEVRKKLQETTVFVRSKRERLGARDR